MKIARPRNLSGFIILLPWALAAAALADAPAAVTPPAEGIQFFEKQIRPLLVDRCYKCHSAEAKTAGKLKGSLYLDSREGLLKGGENGPEVSPGHPEKSRMITAVRWVDDDLKMPPKERLSPSQVAVLEKWVTMGAPDPRAGPAPSAPTGRTLNEGRKWWAFQPLAHIAPPEVKDPSHWARTAPDQFVLAKLQEKGLTPNGPATRAKLIRRAYIDLVGVPPGPEESAQFIGDSSPDAYEKVLDRLLASPHYGERWARHWLDVARFAESDGFEHDSDRPGAYQFRDFVIRALNQDMPFDEFVQWQIAGDELAPDNWQALAATGFLSAGVFPTQITEKEFEFTRYSQLDDMISTVGNSMLGLTIGCARCHDHKFDPISTRDYYRFAACFGNAIRSDLEMPIGGPSQQDAIKRHAAELADARDRLAAFEHDEIPKQLDAFVARSRANPDVLSVAWSVLDFSSVKTASGMQLVKQPDGSLLKSGPTPDRETYILSARTAVMGFNALRVEALMDPSLPHNGPGVADNGNFSLTEIEITAAPADGSVAPARVQIVSAAATHQQNTTSLSVASSFDGNSSTGWAVDLGGIGKSQAAIFRFAQPLGFAGGTTLGITLHFDHPNPRHVMGRPRLAIAFEPADFKGPALIDSRVSDSLAKLIAGQKLPDAESAAAREWFASTLPEYQRLKQDVARIGAEPTKGPMAKVQVTSEGLPPVKNYADDRGYPHFYPLTYLLRRGDPNNKVEVVTASFPQVLMRDGKDAQFWTVAPPPGAHTSFRRASLAHWLTDTDRGAGPLVARVIVNRLWQHHLGQGIVATPNDFGAQGERPTNAPLLEWLASDLVEHGWQLKRLHKLIMSSSAYMQESRVDPRNEAIDPHDVYLWRWQPRRMEAEPVRDSLLSVAGLLDETQFGPGTLDQNMRRRSIYFTVKRSQLISMMMVLDWPEALNSIGQRPVTTVAPQALLFLNSPEARQYAEAFARRISAASDPQAIDQAYQIAFGREVTSPESALAEVFIQKQSASYQATGVANPRSSALADFCQALLSANEFIYVE